MNRKTTRLYNYLADVGFITTYDAIKELGDTRLSATIFNLKKENVKIKDFNIIFKNRYKETIKVKVYCLGNIGYHKAILYYSLKPKFKISGTFTSNIVKCIKKK